MEAMIVAIHPHPQEPPTPTTVDRGSPQLGPAPPITRHEDPCVWGPGLKQRADPMRGRVQRQAVHCVDLTDSIAAAAAKDDDDGDDNDKATSALEGRESSSGYGHARQVIGGGLVAIGSTFAFCASTNRLSRPCFDLPASDLGWRHQRSRPPSSKTHVRAPRAARTRRHDGRVRRGRLWRQGRRRRPGL
jgi:hypothetical protein